MEVARLEKLALEEQEAAGQAYQADTVMQDEEVKQSAEPV